MRSVLILGLATGLLVGCGNKTTKLSALEQCALDLAINAEMSAQASDYDKSKGIAIAKLSCAPVLDDQKLFEKMALDYLYANLKNPDELKISGTEYFDGTDYSTAIGFNIGIESPHLDPVYPAKRGYGVALNLNTYTLELFNL